MNEISLEQATLADAEALTALSKAAFDTDTAVGNSEVGGPPGYDDPDFHRRMADKGFLYAARGADGIIGGAIVFRDRAHPGELEVGRVFIAPECHRKGYGLKLMAAVEALFPGEITAWKLDTPLWNVRTCRFYPKAGYSLVDEKDGFAFFRKDAKGRVLETDRLFLREMTEADLPALEDMMMNPAVMYAYNGPFTKEETRAWLGRQIARYQRDGFGLWAAVLKRTGEMVGQCGLTLQPVGEEIVPEVGYLFREKFWHNGYAAEAARACRDYAFHTLRVPEVFSIIRTTNAASRKVAERNGMTVVREFIKHFRGEDMPHVLYSVKNPR